MKRQRISTHNLLSLSLLTPTLFATVVALGVLIAPSWGAAATYYVCDSGTACNAGKGSGWGTGSDSRSVVQARNKSTPWKSIDHAEENVVAGDTVIVGDGSYSASAKEWNRVVLYIQASGKPGSPITFKAENRWGAIIRAGAQSNYGGIWFDCDHTPSPASYVTIKGFDIRNFRIAGIVAKDNNGAPYTRCTNLTLSELKIHDIGEQGMSLGATDDSVIEQSFIFHLTTPHSNHNHYHGIYLSDNTDNITVRNNVVYDIPHGWPIHVYDGHGQGDATNHLIINNVLVDENAHRDGGMVLRGDRHIVRNNIMYTAVDFSSQKHAIGDNIGTGVGTVIENNITNQPVLCSKGCGGATMRNNILGADLAREFVDRAKRNYALRQGARSIDRGTSSRAPRIDINGVSRPQGGGFDIGAYEFRGGGSTTPDTTPPAAPRNVRVR